MLLLLFFISFCIGLPLICENKFLINFTALLERKVDTENWENKRGPRPWEETVQQDRPTKRS
jgi:hypothetical protein